jgi:hypothetical protein
MSKNKPVKKQQELRDWLRVGGEARLHRGAVAEIYELEGPERKRSSAAGFKTIVGPLLDPRLKLTPQQRAVGNAYGGFVEIYNMAGGPEWIREHVDKGTSGSGGYSERVAMIGAMVSAAQDALRKAGSLRYVLGKSRTKTGSHKPIPMLEVVNYVCVMGRSADFIALMYGWHVERSGKVLVPDRQRKRITAGLRDALDVIADDWQERGFTIPAELSMIEVD